MSRNLTRITGASCPRRATFVLSWRPTSDRNIAPSRAKAASAAADCVVGREEEEEEEVEEEEEEEEEEEDDDDDDDDDDDEDDNDNAVEDAFIRC